MKKPKWTPPPRNPLEMAPVVEKFLSWRYKEPPAERPKAASLTTRQKQRLLRLTLVGKVMNWDASVWGTLRRDGATDEQLYRAVYNESRVSHVRNPLDKRRARVSLHHKGKTIFFIIGEHHDPDRFVLEGVELLSYVRQAMKIKRNS